MTTLKAYARKMFELMPNGVGRAEAVSSLTTTTIVCNTLAFGGVTGQKFVNKWLLRRDTASAADRLRLCTDFTAASGTLTHAGTNYADTTATNEIVEILDYEPYLIDLAIQRTLARLKRQDSYILPTRQGVTRYYLGELEWLTEPGDIIDVASCGSPVITNNRYMEKWGQYDSNGKLTPDSWTLAGSAATMARSTTNNRTLGSYNVAITRAGTDCSLSQTPGLLETGVAGDSLAGQTVTAVAWVWSSVASQVRVQVDDGVTVTSSSYHTGGSGWEELSVDKTLSADATTLTVQIAVESDNAAAYVDEAYLCVGTVTDTVRRNAYSMQPLARNQWDFAQDEGVIYLPSRGRGQQYVVRTKRPYPQFDATRIATGAADGDTSDAPETHIATGAIGRLFEALWENETSETVKARYLVQANTWNRRFEQLALKHMEQRSERGFGVDLPVVMAGRRMGRV